MRNKTLVPAATFKQLFAEVFSPQFIHGRLRACGCRRRCPPVVSAAELICGLVFHVVAGPGKLAAHVNKLTGKSITDGALAQRRALLPLEIFEGMMGAALKPKADPARHPDAFYHGLRLCGIDGSSFSVTNTPQVKKRMKKARSRRGRAAFPKVGVAVMVELGLHNPLAAALGSDGESEMVLSKRLVPAQPEKSLLISDRYYGIPALLVDLPAQGQRHFLVRVKTRLKRRLLQVYPDGSALVEIGSGEKTRQVREVLARVQRGGGGAFSTVRLWTSLLDWQRCPAQELLALYGKRWEAHHRSNLFWAEQIGGNLQELPEPLHQRKGLQEADPQHADLARLGGLDTVVHQDRISQNQGLGDTISRGEHRVNVSAEAGYFWRSRSGSGVAGSGFVSPARIESNCLSIRKSTFVSSSRTGGMCLMCTPHPPCIPISLPSGIEAEIVVTVILHEFVAAKLTVI